MTAEDFQPSLEYAHDSYPGEAAACAAAVAAVLPMIQRLSQLTGNLTDVELTTVGRSLALVQQQSEAGLVAVTSDAIDRGTVYRSTAADATQWVRRLSTGESADALLGAESLSVAGPLVPLEEPTSPPAADDSDASPTDDELRRSGLEPSHASRIAKLAEAARSPLNHALTDAVTSGQVNTTIGKTCLDTIDKIKAVLPKASRDEIYGWLLTLGPGAGAKTVRELTKRILAQYSEEVLDENEDALQKVESLSWSDLPGGMVRFTADLSPDHAEALIHGVQSLAAPSPKSACCDDPHHRHTPDQDGNSQKTGEPDPRTPGKRRADAFLLLLGLGAAAVDNDPEVTHRGSATLVVTIDFLVLAGLLAGLGVTDTGTGVTPDTVRQLACDADILPMVLGSKNQPLNVGRKRRLVDNELRRAVIHRDKHCTHAGCDRPPVMCEVHHLIPWHLGGETSLTNSALLCDTHHRIAHRDHLTGTATDTSVTWHYQATSTHAV
ncbi:HNH endonuclease [Calidifontibacter indicus]|uniref:HNH endonuclease n=1 Tax=Calidifontibacter indicus TaxID=419650 RepID=A0A3D9UQV6_9MICO|nr:HNH endonuclease signature motif containing protein [Calidifontibacter indicus]REF31832.1 HNH endonuclease [Calidifontibacter indicus]